MGSLLLSRYIPRLFAACLILAATALAATSRETILHQFNTKGDGVQPFATVIADKSGNLYGTTTGGGSGPAGCAVDIVSAECGTVYQLSPPKVSGGAWTETILYSFQGGTDGVSPNGLAMDAAGNLYGTTAGGGLANCTSANGSAVGCGTVFELSPPAVSGGQWTETVLYRFTGGADGLGPLAPTIIDRAGNLYSTTNSGGVANCAAASNGQAVGCGTVFELSPNGDGTWTEKTLYAFQGGNDGGFPYGAGVIMGAAGKLYGTNVYAGGTSNYCQVIGCGTVYELSPPLSKSGAWKETVLHTFPFVTSTDPSGPGPGLILQGGTLIGTTGTGGQYSHGTAFQLTPSGSSWTFNIIYNFGGTQGDAGAPSLGLVADGKGDLYGTSLYGGKGTCNSGCGAVFELVPPSTSGGSWSENVLYSFRGGTAGVGPQAGVTLNKGMLYGTTASGGGGSCEAILGRQGCGTVFSVTP
jgi:hypothetical protein